ncbi:hypothetical protein L227DRAFT_573873 [Lentinus tigrinus ALCF2SS1-6]|uniref:Uncharacterized protein n=1 Tax=Lentinus tigrinus ALCF2SS1-6 TaxID=1328759 RepID=A0A5C2SDW6_9APHY|nr:hypothetical protein L227DRAFT_573873 [Lentinus tigrinus ALCF2SS1-6]
MTPGYAQRPSCRSVYGSVAELRSMTHQGQSWWCVANHNAAIESTRHQSSPFSDQCGGYSDMSLDDGLLAPAADILRGNKERVTFRTEGVSRRAGVTGGSYKAASLADDDIYGMISVVDSRTCDIRGGPGQDPPAIHCGDRERTLVILLEVSCMLSAGTLSGQAWPGPCFSALTGHMLILLLSPYGI